MGWLGKLKCRASLLRAETFALWFAIHHPSTPWYAKAWLLFIVAYALSPIDLIPDFIPVLGYIDELILLPLGIALAVRMIPPEVMRECRTRAQHRIAQTLRLGWIAAIVVLLIWSALAAALLFWFRDHFT